MQYKLYPKDKVGLTLFHQRLHSTAVIHCILFPVGESCRVIFVAKDTEGGVWQKPVFIVFLEFYEILVAA